MWPSDSILTEILSPIFFRGYSFQCLPDQIKPADAASRESLRAGFERVLRCKDAKNARRVVFFWALDQPYTHRNGLLSTVVYIEQTKGSIFGRWPPGHIDKLARGAEAKVSPEITDWRRLARQCGSENGRFYRPIIESYGPLRVWWADVHSLNKSSNRTLSSPQEWECLLLTSYRKRYGCLPLKNARCG